MTNTKNTSIRWLAAVYLACCTNAVVEGDAAVPGAERPAWRLESLNDFYFGKDQELSGAWSLQAHTGTASRWDDLTGMPAFVRRWGAAIPTLNGPGRSYRVSAAIGQITQTPGDLEREELIEDDVPYAGALLFSLSWYGYDDRNFSGLEAVTGIVGPASGVDSVQTTSHELLGITEPEGWDNQLHNEPVLNFNYLRKHKLIRADAFDAAVSGRFCIGNLITQAGVGIELRYGRNLPGGFVHVPDPLGFGLTHRAALAAANPTAASLYGSLVLRATAVAQDLFLDGNSFRDSHSVDKELFIGQAVAGLHYDRQNWSAHFNLLIPTTRVDTSDAQEVDGNSELAALVLEWHY